MEESTNREIHLKRRPVGLPSENDFQLVTGPMPAPADGEVLVRNIYMSVDPYMRGRMIERKSYVPSFKLGEPLTGDCVGQVVDSRGGPFEVGDYVLGYKGWREFFTSGGRGLREIDPDIAPIQAYLGTMGMPGRSAYVGLLDVGRPVAGETVYVSAAAGAVGSIVCQIAKIKGCRVVGSAGSGAKVTWLVEEAGVDAAFNYKEVESLSAELGRLCPEGIDLSFENVGGENLEAALRRMNNHGRVVMCGQIAQYNATEPPRGPRNLGWVITKRLRIEGFIISDHNDRRPQFEADMRRWIADGRIKWQETVFQGIENAPKAFLGLFSGENLGKMLVKLGPE
jgi:NADPH-dependent curcumin reductase CurA